MTYIFVEGPDDERFVSRILAPIIGEYQIIQYASMPNAKVNNFIRTINQMSSYDYIFLGDADGKSINDRKAQLVAKYIALSYEKSVCCSIRNRKLVLCRSVRGSVPKIAIKEFRVCYR